VRWFSAFPDRGAGVGLLLLRLAAGFALVLHGEARLAGPGAAVGETLGAVLSIAAGAALLTGLFTAAAAVAATVISVFESVVLASDPSPVSSGQAPLFVMLLLVSMAIALLGPGAFSIDSYRFGRREIVIPGDPPARRH
jgi:uncharacterized membrane protein YphA (DoxX/SURF4 family)